MTTLKVIAMPTEHARAYQHGALDANGLPPEKHIASGTGNPCRHCLKSIEEGAEMLVLAYRPFDALQPYAEMGPIFLHGRECERHGENSGLPEMFNHRESMLVRGYGDNNRIQYKSARIVPVVELEQQCFDLLGEQNVSYLHVRSTNYNCFQCRLELSS